MTSIATAGAQCPGLSRRLTDYRTFGVVAGCAYVLRDCFAAMWRWLLDMTGLPFLWFAVDFAGLAALAAFAWEFGGRRRAPFALYALAMLPASLFIAAATVDANPTFLAAAMKMILPLYAGWLLAGTDMASSPHIRRIVLVTCLASVTGVVLNQVVTYPWTGFAVEQFGLTKTVDKIWWIQSTTRFSGLSGESTTSAAIALFSFLLVHRKLHPAAALATGVAVIAACHIATSRTALVVAVLATAYVAAEGYLAARLRSAEAHRLVALGSFAMVLVPLALVAASSTIRFDEIAPPLASLQQRINDSWQYPLTLLADRSPSSLIFGCGLGCLTFPAGYSNWAPLLRPIDNFTIVSLAMFGIGYLPILAGMVLAAVREGDRTKLFLLFAINLYTFSIEGFSPAFTLFVIGYASSGMHLIRFDAARAGQRFAPLNRLA